MRVLGRIVLVLAIATVAACGNPNTGVGVEVIDGHVVRVITAGDRDGAKYQRLAVQLDDSLYRGEVVELEWDGRRALNENGFLSPGDPVLLTLSREGNTRTYTISEIVRLPSLWPLVVLLALALVAVGRWKGVASLAGLGASIAVFLLAVLPAVRSGDDPLLATLLGSVGVLVVAAYHFGTSDHSGRQLIGLAALTAAATLAERFPVPINAENGETLAIERKDFDFPRSVVRFERKRAGRSTESRQTRLPVDTLTAEGIAGILRFLPFDGWRPFNAHFFTSEPQLYDIRIDMRGKERVVVPAGQYECYKVELVPQLGILNAHLAGRKWFALDRLTLADIALASIVKRCLEFPIERPAYSELERWQAAIDARAAFAVAIGAKPSALTPAA